MRHDDDGRVVEIGARTRTIPPALRRALHHRDHGCRFPGCGVAVGQGHHVRHWAQGGPTTLSNLALLCRRHDRAVHEEGYQVDRQPDGTLRFRRPDDRPLPDVPPPPAVRADPVDTLRSRHEAEGLRLHARTTCPLWLGGAWMWAGPSTCCIRWPRGPWGRDDQPCRLIVCVTAIISRDTVDRPDWPHRRSERELLRGRSDGDSAGARLLDRSGDESTRLGVLDDAPEVGEAGGAARGAPRCRGSS